MTIESVDPPKTNQTEPSETPTEEPQPQPPLSIWPYDGPTRGDGSVAANHAEADGGE